MEVLHQGNYLMFAQKLCYELENQLYACSMKFDEQYTWNNEHFKIQQQLRMERMEEGICDIRFEIENISKEDIVLKEFILLDIAKSTRIKLGDGDFRTYQFYRQGRHKNDLPGICNLGTFDKNFEDASSSLLESGEGMSGQEAVRALVSDSMTIIKAPEKCQNTHQNTENTRNSNSVLLGYLTGRNQFVDTTLRLSEKEGETVWEGLSSKTTFQTRLEAGRKVTTEWLRIDLSSRNVETKIKEFATYKARQFQAKKAKKAPSVFCTWYYYGLTVTYQDVIENLTEMKRKKLPFDVFQIDEGWEMTLGEWEPNEKFPKSMKEIATEIIDAGYIPGIWTSPFIASAWCTVWKEHPEWVLKDKKGEPVEFPMNDTVYYVFDITNAKTYDYFTKLYRKLRYDWGYVYHKLDFTRAAVIYEDAKFQDDTITLVEAYVRAVRAIRKGMGEDAYFLMCGGLYDPLIGVVDAQRVGSDVLSMWSSNINTGGKTAPYTIKQNLLRYYMNAWWNNDPDALMVRRNETMERGQRLTYGLLNDEEVKTSVANQYFGGGLLCSTEPLASIDDDRLYQLKHIIPTVEMEVEPRYLFDKNRYPSVVDAYLTKTESHSVAMINWSDSDEIAAQLTICKELLGDDASPEEEYVVCAYYEKEYRTHVKYGETINLGTIKPHGTEVFKVVKQSIANEHPIVIASNAHYSLGAEIDELCIREDSLYIAIDFLFTQPSSYTILLPEGYETVDGKQEITVDVEGRGKHEVEVKVLRKVSSFKKSQ